MKLALPRILWIAFFSIIVFSCKKNDGQLSQDPKDRYALDAAQSDEFYTKHPEFKSYRSKISELYTSDGNKMLWYDKDGRIDFAEVLYDKALQIEKEGVPVDLPYKSEYADLFEQRDTKKPSTEDDMLVSALYIFYVDKVYAGIPPVQSRKMGWFLPRKKISYVSYLDTLMQDPSLLKAGKMETFSQYENLRKALGKYREIEKKGGWATIASIGKKTLKKGDSDAIVAQVRKRLTISGDLNSDSGSLVFDAELEDAIVSFNKRRFMDDKIINAELIKELNVPVSERIKTIVVNMERCRWISPDFEKAFEYVAVNIPSYHLTYIKDGKPALESNVVVGKALNKTVVFSGKMSYLVFSPYWNIPKSIVKKEIEPNIAKDPNYLEKENIEKVGENYRQKPGPKNSLGLVKFMFPNNNNIYLHDSPAKSLFNRDERAFSHGCVRVQKAKELAYKILEDDKRMSRSKIDEAMNSGEEKQYPLNRKIPVYIAYFTAMADENGNVAFFDDVYNRDPRLARLLYN
ncbi:L,D-transpeptidase family protein [Flavobacterium sp. MAH-1]|uniref:L,D-transpeptidase family protein n=1 Tax=Flavobacterium agri TaxID=2743471 RepID=A0A7Y8XZA9_9FLAO|nr:L,D-transpeptidase family protein [Flavobacterium agri]NUY79477.1 L,D-transpeptidase family protein [Flavobacterium agri]NYA69502.1 L,D-transpeptidase family protein [Flavobacterium agri]